MHRTLRLAWIAALGGLAGLQAPAAPAGTTAAGPRLTETRFWSSPTNTRVVLEFSGAVAHVGPDSGWARAIHIAVPGPGLERDAAAGPVLRVGDGVVDSLVADVAGGAGRFRLLLRDSTRFRVYTLPADGEQGFRIVVDVVRLGAMVAEQSRLERIAAGKGRVRIVAVDAGHGGEDSGARGPGGVLEKHVTLAVARELVAELNRIPGLRGELTRGGDYFIPLRDRYRAAERMKADLFVSIHANSSRRRGVGRGTEVFFLSLQGASDQAVADLADLENAADRIGGVPPQAQDDLVNILYDVKRSSAQQQSQLLAETLLDHIAADRRLESRGIKQAGFVVLKSVEFPSVLVETAFINHPVEAKLLASRAFQQQIARQLADGIRVYFQRAGVPLLGQAGGRAGRGS